MRIHGKYGEHLRGHLRRCHLCPAGHYQTNYTSAQHVRAVNRTSCALCRTGQYQPQTGQTKCKWCVPPKVVDDSQQSSRAIAVQPPNSRALTTTGLVSIMVVSTDSTECYEACPGGRYSPSETRMSAHRGQHQE